MNREDIKRILPHREPMLLVDNVEIKGEKVVSQYTIRNNDFFTIGHFPGNPIVPGVILCEIMAQGSFLLIEPEKLATNLALYAGINGVKFRNIVRCGDTVVTESTIETVKGPMIIVNATATVDGQQCCSAKLSFMLIPKDKLK